MDALRLANSAFAVDLFKQLCEKEPAGNVLFSPICLSTSLSLAQVGAKGDTANEIEQVLHFENIKDIPFGFQTVTSDVNKLSSFYSLKLIKRLYVDKSLNPSTEFISSTKRPYAKEMETVDFKDKLEETKGQINQSIKDLTDVFNLSCNIGRTGYMSSVQNANAGPIFKKCIKDIKVVTEEQETRTGLCTLMSQVCEVGPELQCGRSQGLGRFENILADNSVSDQTKILVVNAAYFVGKWMKKFPESETKECPFRINKTDTKPVQMMSMEATFCMGNVDGINCKIIELPFQNKHLSMLILLPKDVEDESTGLEKVEKQLNSETLLQWTNPSTMANAKVKLSIPKFKVEKLVDPKASLENLGLKNIFNENTSDFSGMSETKGVALSNVIHRVCLEITEDGGDSIEVPGSRILQHKDEFNADHPFIYIIRHNKTRNIIFFGKFCSP